MAKAATKDQVEDQALDDQVDSVLEYSSDVGDQERPEPLPVGLYRAQIVDAKIHTSATSGKQSLALTHSIGPDAMPADYVETYQLDEKKLTSYHKVVGDDPQRRYNMRRLCESLGLPAGRRIDIKQFIGAEEQLEIRHQPDLEGNPSETVGKILKA